MLRDNLMELIEPMRNSARVDPLALCTPTQATASDDRLPCLENPRPVGAETSLTENVTSPFQAEPAHYQGDTKAVSLFLDAGMSLNERSVEGLTVLFAATRNNDIQ